MSQQQRSVASFYRFLQDRCYAGRERPSRAAQRGAEAQQHRLVNDTLSNYIMDNLSAYVYPNLVYALLLQTDRGEGRALVANEYRTLGHRIELRALQRASTDLDLQIRQAEQSKDDGMLRNLRRARELAADRNGRLGLAEDGYPHLTLLLEQANLLNRSDAREHREREQTFIEEWRASLMVHIQSMCAVLDDFEIVKGTGDPRSREREQFKDKEWTEACYRQNLPHEKMGVLYDKSDLDVLRGRGRLVNCHDDGVTLNKGTTWDFTFITNLFLAFSDCFTFECVTQADLGDRSKTRALKRDPLGRNQGELVLVTLDKPHLVRRTNRVLQPGLYRLDYTNFLLTKGAKRSVAVRSNFCERDGSLRFAETHYARPNFDGEAPVVRTYHAGTANLFFAVSRKAQVRGLLGFWIGSLIRNTQIDNAGTEIVHNRATSALGECCVQHENEAYNRVVLRDVAARAGVPAHVTVILQSGDGSIASAKDAEHSVLYNGLMVEYLCAAQPSSLCPPKEGRAKAPFAKHQSVGAFLFLYALVYYSKYSLKSLTLFVRAWQYVDAKAGKETKYDVVSGSIANYYNANFGLSFVPAKLPNMRLDSERAVSERIQEEIGWKHMKQKYASAFDRKWKVADLLNEHSEFCHFFTLLKAVENDDKLVDLNLVTQQPLFKSNYYFQSPMAVEQREGGYSDTKKKTKVVILSDGFMFRHYPHLAELEMRAVDLYLGVLESRRRSAGSNQALWKKESKWYQSSVGGAPRYKPDRNAVQKLLAHPVIDEEMLEQSILRPDRQRRARHSLDDSADESGAACTFDERRQNLRNEVARRIQSSARRESKDLQKLAFFADAGRLRDEEEEQREQQQQQQDEKEPKVTEDMEQDLPSGLVLDQDDEEEPGQLEDDDNDNDGEPLYDVERIVGHKNRGQTRLYKVRWVGYSAKDDTFEPLVNLWNAVDFIYEYHTRVGLEPNAEAKEAFRSFCRDWHGWTWTKNSCAHDSVLVAMLAPEMNNPLRDELTLELPSDSASTKRVRARLRKAWRDIRLPKPSDTCWSLRMALAREFPQQREMLIGGKFIAASGIVDLLFEKFVQKRPFWCIVNNASNGNATVSANVGWPMIPLTQLGDVEPLVQKFFGPRERRVEGKPRQYQYVLIDSADDPLQYFWISKQTGQSALVDVLRLDAVERCDRAAIDGERHTVKLQLTALVAAKPSHFVCAFRCLNTWYHYDDSPGSQPTIERIGTLADLAKFSRGFYTKKTEHLYYVRVDK